eukprot:3265964-Prymnesium_polylepis.1
MDVVPQWERGVVAVGAWSDESPPALVGSGFIIDADAGLIATCAHVLQDVNRRLGVPPPAWATVGVVGVAIGVGSPVQWLWRAQVLRVSQPPAP